MKNFQSKLLVALSTVIFVASIYALFGGEASGIERNLAASGLILGCIALIKSREGERIE